MHSRSKPFRVAEVVVDAVEDVDAVMRARPARRSRATAASARGRAPAAPASPWRDRWCPSRSRPAAISESRASSAIARMLKMASGVSIIAQTRVLRSMCMSSSRRPISSSCSGCEIFGTRMASGAACAAAARSSACHGVSMPLTRMNTSRLPKPPALTASATCARACSLASGATASSRSRITPSTGSVRAFSMARAFEPGM